MSRRGHTVSDQALPENRPEDALGRIYDSQLIARLIRYLLPYRRTLGYAILLMPVLSALRLAQPLILMAAIDGPIVSGDTKQLALLALLFCGALVLEFSALFGHLYFVQVAGQKAMTDLRYELFRHVQSLRSSFFHRTPLGRLITRVTTDVDALNEMFAMGVVQIVGDIFSLTLILIAMAALSTRLSLVTLAVVPPLVLFVLFCRRFLRAAFRQIRLRIARINAYLSEALAGVSVIQAFGREALCKGEFDDLNDSYRQANTTSIVWDASLFAVVEMLGAITIAGLLWFASDEIASGATTFGVLVAFIEYARKFFIPIRDLSAKFTIMQSAMASAERIFGLLDTHEYIEDPSEEAALPTGAQSGRVSLDDVHFGYNADEPVLRGLSLEAVPGEKLAIVGPTGVGKTTLISLLLRFYDVSSGRILLDGVDIRQLRKSTLRNRFAVVLQDVFLFPGTLADNISLGDPQISRSQIEEACRIVHVDRILERLDDGLDHMVLERGANFSAGEKQLISFARALCRDPQVLILDEATSAVDPETEALVESALGRLLHDRTSIVIAHRLSTVRNADRIVVLHRGAVVEDGSHGALLDHGGLYARLYRLQLGSHSTAAA